MPLTLSTFDPVLKDFWEPGIKEQINSDVPAFKLFESSAKQFSGRRVIYPIHTGRNSGVGARAEGGTLPTAGEQGHNLASVSATYQYGTIRLSGQTLAAGKHAWAEALSLEMEGLRKDCVNDWGRQTWGMGDGRLAQVTFSATAASGSVIIPIVNRFTRAGQPGARYLSVGQVIDIGSIVAGQLGVSQTLSAVSISTNPATTTDSITLGNSSVLISATDNFIYNNGAGGSGGVGLEMLGLQALVDVFTEANMWGSNAFWSAALTGINRSAVSAWNANILANSGTTRVLDSYLMQQGFDQVHQDAGEDADFIFCHHSVRRALFDNAVADRRYAAKLDMGGAGGLSYDGVPVVVDRLAPYNTLLMGKKSAIEKFVLKDMGFEDRDGAILSRRVGIDGFDGFFSYYANMGVVGNMKSLLFIRDIRTDL